MRERQAQELRCQSIVVLNPSEDGEGDQPSVLRWRLLQLRVRLGYGMCGLRGARAVVEGDEFTRDPSNMIFAQDSELLSQGEVLEDERTLAFEE